MLTVRDPGGEATRADARGALSSRARTRHSDATQYLPLLAFLRGYSPARYKFAVNMTTAKVLRLDVPASILLRADELIE